MRRLPWLIALAAFAAGSSACKDDACKGLGPSFQLDVSVPPALSGSIRSLAVRVQADQLVWSQVIPVVDQLSDQTTSLAINLEPAPTAAFRLEVEVTARDAGGRSIAGGTNAIDATPDGCNTLNVVLGAAREDGGVTDLGADTGTGSDAGDSGPTDSTLSDTGEEDAPSGDALPGDADGGPADQGLDGGADGGADSGVDVGFDAGVDAGPIGFPYPPSNFDPTTLTPGPSWLIPTSTCTVTFDSSGAPGFTQTCGVSPLPTPVLVNSAGVSLVVLPTESLLIQAGGSLRLIGERPVVVAVYGDANIGGLIEASGLGTTPGAGGSDAALCAMGAADAQLPAASARAGGGGGGFVSGGAAGGADPSGANAGGPGLSEPHQDLVPLRGGCPGGAGGAGATGGAGGGALQISAAGRFLLTSNGRLNAGGGGGTAGEEREGGGGGGSGGALFLEANAIEALGNLYASGGGGGGGGGTGDRGDRGNDGNRGNPVGGGGGPASGGDGGNGAGAVPTPTPGEAAGFGSTAGGGGGGGGPGAIRLRGLQSCTRVGFARPTPLPSSDC